MRRQLATSVVGLVWLALTLPGCQVDTGYTPAPAGDASTDAAPPSDSAVESGPPVDSGPPTDGGSCTPLLQACNGDLLQECRPDGSGFETLADCPLGCDPAAPACYELVPSNGIDPAWLAEGTQPLDTATLGITSCIWDTSSGTINCFGTGGLPIALRGSGPGIDNGIGFHFVAQGGSAPDIAVWTFASIDIDAASTHRFEGNLPAADQPPPAAALVAGGAIRIAGELDLDARDLGTGVDYHPGPGGWRGGEVNVDLGGGSMVGAGPGAGPATGIDCDSGGGGGGYGDVGGTGGATSLACSGGTPVPGGSAYGDPALSPLLGGSGGGAGGGQSNESGRGAGGGGAIQIVSGANITLSGSIHASGGGGGPSPVWGGSGGGGAGGAVLLEAPVVVVSGVIASNGGGGGGGADQSGGAGTPGATGSASDVPAPGGPSTDGNVASGEGGAGGAGATPAQDGTGNLENGGGGGGAVGRVRIHTRDGSFLSSGVVSPAATTGMVVTQ